LQIRGGKKRSSPKRELCEYFVDLIIINLGKNELVLGMDMEKPDQLSDPILAFNEFSSSNFEDLLIHSNALLVSNGVFVILRPL
jgi:hypothetical protein